MSRLFYLVVFCFLKWRTGCPFAKNRAACGGFGLETRSYMRGVLFGGVVSCSNQSRTVGILLFDPFIFLSLSRV